MLILKGTPDFYKGTNLLMLDTILSVEIIDRINSFNIKCYYRTFDDLHPNAIAKHLPQPQENCLVITINPAVVDQFFYTSAQHVMESTYFTRTGKILGLSLDSAHQIYNAYQVGIQHVSEIMLTHGYWRP